MKKRTNFKTYLKLARRELVAISMLAKTEDNRPIFERHKKKAAHYIEKAKALGAPEK